MTFRLARLAAVALLAGLALFALPGATLAQTCPRTSVADIEDEVMCPVCKTPLGLAQEAPQADRQRVFILERVERCQSKATIKAALADEFGEEVLAVPEDEGFDLAAYLVPALGLAVALGASALAVSRWRRARGTAAADERPQGPPTTSGAEAAARLERDLERYDL